MRNDNCTRALFLIGDDGNVHRARPFIYHTVFVPAHVFRIHRNQPRNDEKQELTKKNEESFVSTPMRPQSER